MQSGFDPSPGKASFEWQPAATFSHYSSLVPTSPRVAPTAWAFALLHYEKALHEFDALKRATTARDLERMYVHGVYCVAAVAACLEAVANRLAFDASGKHSAASESGTALGRINFAARRIASERGVTFNGLGGKRPEAVFAERIRLLHNSFVHANESGAPVNITHLTSDQMASVNEDACRGFLVNLRLTIAFVFDQIPWVTKPLVTATNVKWLGEIEVP